jgi:hypothetical protein
MARSRSPKSAKISPECCADEEHALDGYCLVLKPSDAAFHARDQIGCDN